VVVIDEAIAVTWGKLLARATAAAVHQMTLITRNEMDFAAAAIKTFHPWSQ
jgi:predicted nucleic acid-binding protein